MTAHACRLCDAPLHHVFADLGSTPLSNAYLTSAALHRMEPHYPLCAYVCSECLLVQVPEFEAPGTIFSDDYAYFSSMSSGWLRHCRAYVDGVVQRFGLGTSHRVVEVASNDGYLLQYFAPYGISVLGVEPAAGCADAARTKGVPTWTRFFGTDTARDLVAHEGPADLLIGNNVLAHVPDLRDFVKGLKTALAPGGVLTMEFPHLLRLIEGRQFDTIYHEHFSYLSLIVVTRLFAAHGLTVFDVDELPTHGGSLRIYATHAEETVHPSTGRVEALVEQEVDAGLTDVRTYTQFMDEVVAVKRQVLTYLLDAKRRGKSVAAYGAAAKGNTLLNYCGVGPELVEYVADLSPSKQGTWLPGTRIPVVAPEELLRRRPDVVVILPWNLRREIAEQMREVTAWGGTFVTFIPELWTSEDVPSGDGLVDAAPKRTPRQGHPSVQPVALVHLQPTRREPRASSLRGDRN